MLMACVLSVGGCGFFQAATTEGDVAAAEIAKSGDGLVERAFYQASTLDPPEVVVLFATGADDETAHDFFCEVIREIMSTPARTGIRVTAWSSGGDRYLGAIMEDGSLDDISCP